MARGARLRDVGLATIDGLGAIAVATAAVALLEGVAPVTGLGVVYLLAVLFVASRRGEVAALGTAIASVLTLNFFFIQPRHRLTIADSHNVVALGVFLIAGVLVSRLAAAARHRAEEADVRAREAAARERESALLAAVASSLLSEGGVDSSLAEAAAEAGLRVELRGAPSPHEGETTVPLRLRSRRAWLYSRPDAEGTHEELDRIAEPLARVGGGAPGRQGAA